MISYNPLWKLLIDRNMKRTILRHENIIAGATLAKMGKNEYVSLSVLEDICLFLDCRIEDVVEIKKDPSPSHEDKSQIVY